MVGAASMGAAGGIAQLAIFTAIMTWLKMLLAQAIAAAQSFWVGIVAFFMAPINAVTGFFSAVGSVLSVGSSVSMVAGILVTSGVATAITGSIFVANSTASQVVELPITQCQVDSVRKAADTNADPTGIESTKTEYARVIYSVFSTWGMSDENIAGILGNWDAESSIDPTSVQDIFQPKYVISDQKQKNAQDTVNGIGLGQWTFERNTNLRDFAAASGKNWWDLGTQLAFMISPAEGANAQIVQELIDTAQVSPSDAAQFFHDKWERSADTAQMIAERANHAEKWYGMMEAWDTDQDLADSVVSQAGTSLDSAKANQVQKARDTCKKMDTVKVSLKSGGMSFEEAEELMNLYNLEGDSFLDGRYGEFGGPGSCGTNHAMNCVSFSTYFLNKYTSFQHYPMANGARMAKNVATQTDKPLLSVPTVYSIGSGPGSSSDGHTLVVLGIDGDSLIVGEAGYCKYMGRVSVMSAAAMARSAWVFVDMSDELLTQDEIKQS